MKTILSLIVMVLLLSAPVARGENKKAKAKPPATSEEKTEPKVIYKPTESHSFTGLKLKGQLKKPDLSYIYKRTGLRSEQIVDIPENFDDEIIQGAGQF